MLEPDELVLRSVHDVYVLQLRSRSHANAEQPARASQRSWHASSASRSESSSESAGFPSETSPCDAAHTWPTPATRYFSTPQRASALRNLRHIGHGSPSTLLKSLAPPDSCSVRSHVRAPTHARVANGWAYRDSHHDGT